jgi:hypothetical protein
LRESSKIYIENSQQIERKIILQDQEITPLFAPYCSAQIQNSTSRLPSRPWFVYQKWNPVGHGQEVTQGMVGGESAFFLSISTLTGGKTCFVRAECFAQNISFFFC